MLWQYVLQAVVCVLGAVRRVANGPKHVAAHKEIF